MNPTADLHAPYLGDRKGHGELWRLRREADLSQRTLADRIGVSRHLIRRMETGEIAANLDVLEALAALYGHDVTMLMAAARFDRHTYLEALEAKRIEGQMTPEEDATP